MIKNYLRILIVGLVLATQVPMFARSNKPVARHVHKKHRKQGAVNQFDQNVQSQQPKQKNVAKNRQRMSAAKIAGMVAVMLLGAAVVGLLMGFVIPFILRMCL